MTDPIEPADTGEPVAGELVTVDAVIPSSEANKAQGRLAISRTSVQSSLPTAAVVIGTYMFLLFGVDLDPGAGTDMPAVVAAAFVNVFTIVVAWLMNRGKLRGEG